MTKQSPAKSRIASLLPVARNDGLHKTKNPSSSQGRRVLSAVPPELRFQVGTFKRFNVQTCKRHFVAITGAPVDDYFVHHPGLSCEKTGEFGLFIIPFRGL